MDCDCMRAGRLTFVTPKVPLCVFTSGVREIPALAHASTKFFVPWEVYAK